VHGHSADFAFPVKGNQPGQFDALDALLRRDIPVPHAATDRGHGRTTTPAIQVMDAPGDLQFLHVSQVYLIERHVICLDGKSLLEVTALGVTSLTTTGPVPGLSPGSSAADGRAATWSSSSPSSDSRHDLGTAVVSGRPPGALI
jgi:hypothetical protein